MTRRRSRSRGRGRAATLDTGKDDHVTLAITVVIVSPDTTIDDDRWIMMMIHLVLRSNPFLDQSSPDTNGVFFHDCSVEVEPLAEHLVGQSS